MYHQSERNSKALGEKRVRFVYLNFVMPLFFPRKETQVCAKPEKRRKKRKKYFLPFNSLLCQTLWCFQKAHSVYGVRSCTSVDHTHTTLSSKMSRVQWI